MRETSTLPGAPILLPVARCSFGVFAPLVRAPRLPSCVMCVVTIFSRFVLCVPVSCDRVSNRSVLRSIVPLVSLVSCQEGPFSTQNYKPFFFSVSFSITFMGFVFHFDLKSVLKMKLTIFHVTIPT